MFGNVKERVGFGLALGLGLGLGFGLAADTCVWEERLISTKST